MCEISDKLQLCSCSKIDVKTAKHYWIYRRLVQDESIFIIGESLTPYSVCNKTDLANRELLSRLLNEKTVFDKPMQLMQGDLLELSFLVNNGLRRVTYSFKYTNGKWIEEEYDVFHWMKQHEEDKRGEIKNALND